MLCTNAAMNITVLVLERRFKLTRIKNSMTRDTNLSFIVPIASSLRKKILHEKLIAPYFDDKNRFDIDECFIRRRFNEKMTTCGGRKGII